MDAYRRWRLVLFAMWIAVSVAVLASMVSYVVVSAR